MSNDSNKNPKTQNQGSKSDDQKHYNIKKSNEIRKAQASSSRRPIEPKKG